jgi:hypothetical protein
MKLLVIGIDYLNGAMSRLGGCINDAECVKNYYKNLYQIEDCNIKILEDNDKNNMPTKSNIVQSFSWLVDGAKENDLLLFHYSGHGTEVPDKNGDEEDGYDESIISSDGRYILDDEIYELLVKKVPINVKLFATLDCCHSGTGFDLKYIYNEKEPNNIHCCKKNEPFENNVVLLSGCKDNQMSAETVDFGQGKANVRGAMTLLFIHLLEINNGKISYSNLISQMRHMIKDYGYAQEPQFSFNYLPNLNDNIF